MKLSPVTVGTYVVLFVLGAVQGVTGSFQYSRNSPAGPIVLMLLIGATCLLAAWGLRSPAGAFLPGAGWILAAVVMSMPRPNRSVIISATSAGEWFLYGGLAAIALSVVISLALWVTRQQGNR